MHQIKKVKSKNSKRKKNKITFVLFTSQNHAVQFLDYLNSKHPNIKFTMDAEKDGKISFLDVSVSRKNDTFTTSVFRKDTFSGQGTSYFSYCCSLFKINAIKTLIFRAYSTTLALII